MKNRLFINTFLISVTGLLALYFSFARVFLDYDSYNESGLIIFIIFICMVMSLINVYAPRPFLWIAGVLLSALIYLWFFRYEIIGGYMRFYNYIADEYAFHFKTQMYFAMPEGKWLNDADVILMIYYSYVILGVSYTSMIYRHRMLTLPLLVNIISIMIPVIIDKMPVIGYVIPDIVFIFELLIMSGTSNNGSRSVKSRMNIQNMAMLAGMVVMICGVLANAVVPQNRYIKPGMFNKVGDFAVEMYYKAGDRIISSFSKKSEKPGLTGSISIIDNSRLGNTAGVEYSFTEMIQAEVKPDAGNIYIKQFIGKKYNNNSWIEIARTDSDNIDCNLRERYNDSPQEMTSGVLYEAYNWMYSKKTNIACRWMRIIYTELDRGHQLMPVYSYTEDESLFDFESYYKEINNDIFFEYYEIDNQSAIELASSTIWNDNREKEYREYVYKTYLDADCVCKEQFRDILRDFTNNNTPQDVFKAAEYIRQYLADRCTYDLKPGKVPSGEDFIDYFFNKNKKGYCTYFATTAVMMFRSIGIPARYVTGFFFNADQNVIDTEQKFDSDYNIVSVDDSCAHAWIEFYLDNFGWVSFDVTPGNFPIMDLEDLKPDEDETTGADLTTKPEETTSTGDANNTTSATTSGSLDNKTKDASETTTESGKSFKISKTTIKNIIYASAVFVIVIIFTAVVFIRHRVITVKRELLIANYRKNNDGNKCVMLNFKRFSDILEYMGFHRDPDVTYAKYGEFLKENCNYVDNASVDIIMDLIQKAEYSGDVISASEAEESCRVVDELADKVYTEIKFFKKIAMKYIHNFI